MQDIKAHLTVEHIQPPLCDMSWLCILQGLRRSIWTIMAQILYPWSWCHGHEPAGDGGSGEGDGESDSHANIWGFRSEWITQHRMVVFCLLVYSPSSRCTVLLKLGSAENVLNRKLHYFVEGMTAQALAENLKPLEVVVIFLGLQMKSTMLYCTLIASHISCN